MRPDGACLSQPAEHGPSSRARSAPCTSSTPRPSTASPTSCAGRSSTASWSRVRRCARSPSPPPWASRRPTVREALDRPGRRGARHPRAQPRRLGGQPEADSVHDVCCARLVLEGAGIRAWAEATEEQRGECAARWPPTSPRSSRRVLPGAQRAPPRLPRLPGRPDRVTAPGGHAGEPGARAQARAGPGRPAPAQRPRPGRHPRRPGPAARARRHRRGRTTFLDGHLDDAERDIVEALGLLAGRPARLTRSALPDAGWSPTRSRSRPPRG